MKLKKWLAIPILVGVAGLAAIALPIQTKVLLSDAITQLLLSIKHFQQERPEDRVYLHADKPLYSPGETVWLSVYVRDGETMRPSEKSDIVTVQLINPKGGIDHTIRLIAEDGVARGDFQLSEYAVGGLYKLKAFTRWQQNERPVTFFEKEITVQKVVLPRLKMKLEFVKKSYGKGETVAADLSIQTNENQPFKNTDFKTTVMLDGRKVSEIKGQTNESGNALVQFRLPDDLNTSDGLVNISMDYQGQTESIARSIPIVLNKIEMQLLPEGGELVAGLAGRVAFRAANDLGKPADVAGVVKNSEGVVVATFESFHQGMGAFDLTPEKGEKYTVQLTRPVGVSQSFEVPTAKETGVSLRVVKITQNQIFTEVQTSQPQTLTILARVRGKQYFVTTFDCQKEEKIAIPTEEMPAGVAQITLFNQNAEPLAERLAFANRQKQLDIQIETNKEKYLPREKVKMTVKVTDENGKPTAADLSIAVTDDQLLAFADDKSSNILSWLLMESDIKEKVEEPNFYFDPKKEKAEKALDYLLMTAGWRRFTWAQIRSGQVPTFVENGERARLEGFVYRGEDYKLLEGATVQLKGTNQTVKTNKEGRFSMSKIDLSKPQTLVFSAAGFPNVEQTFYEYQDDIIVYLRKPVPMKKNKPTRAKAAMPEIVEEKFLKEQMVVEDADMMVMEQEAEVPRVMPPPPPPAPMPKPMPAPVAKKEAIGVNDDLKVEDEKVIMAEPLNEVVVKDLLEVQLAKPAAPMGEGSSYYRAKEFPKPLYAGQKDPDVRDDFRSTIFWEGHLKVGKNGQQTVEFYASDAITSFNVTTEGIGESGLVGRSEVKFFTQKPFSLSAKMPTEIVQGDALKLPVAFVNNSENVVTGELSFKLPQGLVAAEKLPTELTLQPRQAITKYLFFNTLKPISDKQLFKITFKAKGFKDALEAEMTIVPKGFPVTKSYSGQDLTKTFSIELEDLVEGSLMVDLTAYPSVVGEAMSGLEAMLREPHGCFEQTSSSTYPNILVLNYLMKTGQSNPAISGKAKSLIEKGYQRLISFESKSGGFEWFGGDPAHEGLTAYGLMEFVDMKSVFNGVNEEMLQRTANWLFSRRDGKGGFARNAYALHEFGLTDNETMSIYITWALTRAKFQGLSREMDFAYQTALRTKQPYQLGLAANIFYQIGDATKGKKLLDELMSIQLENGAWDFKGDVRSAPGSSGDALRIETAALALTALLQQENPHRLSVQKCADFLRDSRGGYGGFGNTNSTVLALQALIAYAEFMKRTDEAGAIAIKLDGKEVMRQAYEKGAERIVLTGLEKYFAASKHRLEVVFVDVKNPLPYTLSVNYHRTTPTSNSACAIGLDVKMATVSAKMGETVRCTTTLTNKTTDGQPMTLAIIGIPAGLSPQPWQLKELLEKKVVDFYEIIGNNVIFYYRQMKPSEEKTIHLDLKADLPGNYQAPASTAYLYYTNELKTWVEGSKIQILQ